MAGVARLLTQRANERPEDIAYLSGPDGRRLTWADLARRAAATQALGLPPAARIGIVAADPLEFAATYLGVLAAGRTSWVPLPPASAST
jgi:acyl-CoA synthetase (AMP-forming)/AMP-acid ligase II